MLGLGVVIATVAGLVTGAIVYGVMPAAAATTSPAAPSHAALHALDWAIKLAAMGAILGLFA